jgi:hypothetical protein
MDYEAVMEFGRQVDVLRNRAERKRPSFEDLRQKALLFLQVVCFEKKIRNKGLKLFYQVIKYSHRCSFRF